MRVLFYKRKDQEKFINKILLKISIREAAEICNLSERTIRDWRRGKFLPQFNALQLLCKKTNISFPVNIELKDNYWYAIKGSSAGGKAVFKKYGRIPGDPEYRKKKWYDWWENKGKYKKHIIIGTTKSIKKPSFSKKLAEFVGIMLGDGGITQSQITITLHSKDDKEYGRFIVELIKKLFDVYVGSCYRKKELVVHYVISRKELVLFCTKKLGLKKGNKVKQQIDIPDWIKQNKLYSVACVRGLIDTDGCVFNHQYKINNKQYSYKKISFTSYSDPLRQSVFNILKKNGLNPRFAQRKDVRLDSMKDIKQYFKIFGSHNPKHLRKYKN